jgi:hypothetical protein
MKKNILKARIFSKKRGSHKMTMPNMPRKSKERHFFPYLAGLKNSYPKILRRYESTTGMAEMTPVLATSLIRQVFEESRRKFR